ncbi:MAG: alpha/beta hydrolase [Myxococcota bacterium]
MPEKYVREAGIPILLRHNGASTLPEQPPSGLVGRGVVCLHDAGLQSSVFTDLLGALARLRAATDPANPANATGQAPLAADASAASVPTDTCSIAFDLPGHGRSGSLDALPSIEAMSACARSVASWCRATRPILVGHGMGALVALDWARREPGSIAGLVLCGTSGAFGIRDEAIAFMREVTLGRASRPFDPKRLCPSGSPDRMRRAWFESIQTDPRATLVDLEASQAFARSFAAGDAAGAPRMPVLVVAGASEPAADLDAARALAARLGGRFVALEQAAHWLPLEQPEALAREILAFASSLASSNAASPSSSPRSSAPGPEAA